jgi:hypothetical protein
MAVKFVNFFKSKIADVGGIGSGDVEVNLSAGDGAKCPDISVSGHFYLVFVDVSSNREVVKVTGVSGDTCTIVRGQDGTTPRAFSQDDLVELRLTKGALEDIQGSVASDISDAIDGLLQTGNVVLFGHAAAPTGWTKKVDWTDNSMIVYTTGSPGAGGSDSPKSWATALEVQSVGDHSHTGPSHDHPGADHNHQWYEESPASHAFNSSGNAMALVPGTRTGYTLECPNGSGGAVAVDCYTKKATGTTGLGGTGDTGDDGGHTHTLTQDTFEPIYQEVIAATRN